MSGPATRIGDATAHSHVGSGKTVAIGAPKVLIAGGLACRLTDQHDCSVPFHGVSVIQGARTVLIGGLFASRMGHALACGAVLTSGEPSVLIGGNTVTLNITIGGDDAYKARVQWALGQILQQPDGMLWADRYAGARKDLEIVPYPKADNARHNRRLVGDSKIEWDPDFNFYATQYDRAGNPTANVYVPPEEILFHEMVHGLHHAEGTTGDGETPVPSEPHQKTEEAQTIGNGPFDGTRPTENEWRRQRGWQGHRPDHWITPLNPNLPIFSN